MKWTNNSGVTSSSTWDPTLRFDDESYSLGILRD